MDGNENRIKSKPQTMNECENKHEHESSDPTVASSDAVEVEVEVEVDVKADVEADDNTKDIHIHIHMDKKDETIANLETHIQVLERKLDNLNILNATHEQLAHMARWNEMQASAQCHATILEYTHVMEQLDGMQRTMRIQQLTRSSRVLYDDMVQLEKRLYEMQLDDQLWMLSLSSSSLSSSSSISSMSPRPNRADRRKKIQSFQDKLHQMRDRYDGQCKLLSELLRKQDLLHQLTSAAARGDLETVKSLLAHNQGGGGSGSGIGIGRGKKMSERERARQHVSVSVNTPDETGICAFQYACGQGHVDIVRAMLPMADLHHKDEGTKMTPFQCAVRHQRLGVMEVLLRHNHTHTHTHNENPHANVNANMNVNTNVNANMKVNVNVNVDEPYETGERPIHVACTYGNVPMIQLMMDYGVNLDHVDQNGDCCLHYCARGRVRVGATTMQKKIQQQQKKQKQNHQQQQHDSRETCIRMASLLIENGARCDIRNLDGLTPLTIARTQQNKGVLELLKTVHST